jgi:hypothetical protein
MATIRRVLPRGGGPDCEYTFLTMSGAPRSSEIPSAWRWQAARGGHIDRGVSGPRRSGLCRLGYVSPAKCERNGLVADNLFLFVGLDAELELRPGDLVGDL